MSRNQNYGVFDGSERLSHTFLSSGMPLEQNKVERWQTVSLVNESNEEMKITLIIYLLVRALNALSPKTPPIKPGRSRIF